ncbi:hypothetical protein RCL1_002015 [Eukaryota sp. TZLM3-RCL]
MSIHLSESDSDEAPKEVVSKMPAPKDFHLVDPSAYDIPPPILPPSFHFKQTEARRIFLPPVSSHHTSLFPNTAFKQAPSVLPSTLSTKPKTTLKAFSQIVDQDLQEAYESFISEDLIGTLTDSAIFKGVVLVVILINSVLVGMQTSSYIEKRFATILSTMDHIFMTIFVIELALKFYHGFWTFWKVGWNIFDFLIVAVSLLGSSASYMSSGRVLRILRVLRAFRTLRSISILQGLQVIVQTILKSLPDMANIAGLLLIVMFIWSVIGVSLFGTDVPEHFGTIGEAMFTCFIMLTMDGWYDITKIHRERGLFFPTAIYFCSLILIGAFIFVNLIVGVTINNLLSEYKKIYAREKAQNRPLLMNHDEIIDLRDVIDISAIPPSLWLNQNHGSLPNFSNLDPDSLEKVFLTISVMERNIKEFSDGRKELKNIINVVKTHVKTEVVDFDGTATFKETDIESEEVGEEVGDLLSSLMRKETKDAAEQRSKIINQQKYALSKRKHMIDSMAEEQQRVERARQWMSGFNQKKAVKKLL